MRSAEVVIRHRREAMMRCVEPIAERRDHLGEEATAERDGVADQSPLMGRTRVVPHDDELHVLLELDAPGSLGARCATESAVAELTKAIRDVTAAAAAIATRFELSTRTLHRRLADEGTTFGELVEGEQLRLARALLGDRALTLTDIAYRTGFSGPSAFSREYRRWTGRSPSEDR